MDPVSNFLFLVKLLVDFVSTVIVFEIISSEITHGSCE